MQPQFKARLKSALLFIIILSACKKEGVNQGTVIPDAPEHHLSFDTLNWVFAKDTNVATTFVDIPDSYLVKKIEFVLGVGVEYFSVPVNIPVYTGDSTQKLFYVVNGRHITITKYYQGTNKWDQESQGNVPFDESPAFFFFVLQQIGFTKVQVEFR